MKLLAISIILLFAGCGTHKVTQTTYDLNGKPLLTTTIHQELFAYWTEHKDVHIITPNLSLWIGKAVARPDANSIRAAAEGITRGVTR